MEGGQGEFLLFLALVELLNLLEVLHDDIPLNYFLFINTYKSTKWSQKLSRSIRLASCQLYLKTAGGKHCFFILLLFHAL